MTRDERETHTRVRPPAPVPRSPRPTVVRPNMVHHSVPTINDDTAQPTTVPPVVFDEIAESAGCIACAGQVLATLWFERCHHSLESPTLSSDS